MTMVKGFEDVSENELINVSGAEFGDWSISIGGGGLFSGIEIASGNIMRDIIIPMAQKAKPLNITANVSSGS